MKRIGIGFLASVVIHGALLLCLCALARHGAPEISGRTIDLAILSTAPAGSGGGEAHALAPPAAGAGLPPIDGAGAGQPPGPVAPEIPDAAHPPSDSADDGIDTGAPAEEGGGSGENEPAPSKDAAPPETAARQGRDQVIATPPPPPPRQPPATPGLKPKRRPEAVAQKPAGTPDPFSPKMRAAASSRAREMPPAGSAGAPQGGAADGVAHRQAGAAPPMPGSGIGGGGKRAAEDDDQADYGAIQSRIAGCLRYPKIARKRGWCGRVLVAFTVLPDGRVERPEIRSSCGIALLDQSALQTVKDASPFPRQGSTLRIVVPVVFRLES